MKANTEKKTAKNSASAFTIIELIMSMALISIAISICIQTSGMFNDRLLSIHRRAESRMDMMRLAIYLDDLSEVADVKAICPIEAGTGTGEILREISCTFHHPENFPGTDLTIPIFSLAEHGFVSGEWIPADLPDDTVQSLLLTAATGRTARIDFGIFPAVLAE